MGDDVRYKIACDTSEAVAALKAFYSLEGDVDKQMQAFGVTVEQAGSKAKRAFNDTKTAAGGVKSVTEEMTKQVGNYIASFAGVSGIIQALRDINAEFQKSIDLKKDMLGVAVTVEEMALKIANLPGRKDVSAEGLKRVSDIIFDISKQTNVKPEVASNILFYSESAMGSNAAAKSAATEIARFAGPAGLKPEEVSHIPKLFNLTGADTAAKQQEVLAKLYQAAGNSIATTGEYLQPFIAATANLTTRGFSYEQSLARMTAAVDVTGSVAEAGDMTERLAAITSGRNKKAMEFLEKQAKREGKDFTKMSDPQRTDFVETLWDKYSASGQRDKFKGEMDARGYEAMLKLFSPQGKKRYAEIMEKVSTPDMQAIPAMAEQFTGTQIAKAVQEGVAKQTAEYATGIKTSRETLFRNKVDEIIRQAKATATGMEKVGFGVGSTVNTVTFGMLPDVQKIRAKRDLIQESLVKAYETTEEGTMEYDRIRELYRKVHGKQLARISQDDFNEIYGLTKGFTNLEEGGFASKETFRKITAESEPWRKMSEWELNQAEQFRFTGGVRYGNEAYKTGMEQYFGMAKQEADRQIKALEENTKATQEHTALLKGNQRPVMGIAPGGG